MDKDGLKRIPNLFFGETAIVIFGVGNRNKSLRKHMNCIFPHKSQRGNPCNVVFVLVGLNGAELLNLTI